MSTAPSCRLGTRHEVRSCRDFTPSCRYDNSVPYAHKPTTGSKILASRKREASCIRRVPYFYTCAYTANQLWAPTVGEIIQLLLLSAQVPVCFVHR